MRVNNRWKEWKIVRPLKKVVRSILTHLALPFKKTVHSKLILPARRLIYRRIPIAIITGTNGKTTTTRMLVHILKHHGHVVGYTSTEGAFAGEKMVLDGDSSGCLGAKRVLRDGSITAAVLEQARGGMIKNGLFLDRCDVAALLNIGREQIGMDGVNSLRDMLAIKRMVTDAARTQVVLNSEDPYCAELLHEYAPEKTVAFGMNGNSPIIDNHLKRGGSAVFLQSGKIHFASSNGQIDLIVSVTELPATCGGVVRHNIANAMAAAALALGMGVSRETIREALMRFDNSIECSPNRFNLIDGYEFTLILDNAVNAPALVALMESVNAMPVQGRRRLMITVVGNRPDFVFREVAEAVEGCFDHIVCFDHQEYRRKRKVGEVPERLKTAFEKLGTPPARVDIVGNIEEGLKLLADTVEPEDLLQIQHVDVNKWLPVIRNLFSRHERVERVT